ncbi:MAG: serine hydrolase [Gemmatimonadota bacterium]
MRIRNRTLLLAALVLVGPAAVLRPGRLAAQGARPSPTMNAAIASADSAINAWVTAERIPGAVFLVARDGQVLQERAFGYAELNVLRDGKVVRLAHPVPMTTKDLFDLASVTKVMATTFAVMMLVDRGQVSLDAPLYTYLPDFRGPHKDSITVRNLLTHTAGLRQWVPIYYHARNEKGAYAYIRQLPLKWGVGQGRHYSDLGFMLLGYMVEHVTGQRLNVFVRRELYEPLGLEHTAFNPKARHLGPFAATSQGNPYEKHMVYDSTFGYKCTENPTSFTGWRHYTLVGEVNDGNAYYANGGIAGHAGLFSTAADLHVLLELLLGRGAYGGKRYISARVVNEFLQPLWFGNGLGWGMAPNMVELQHAPAGTFGHTGFTGTFVAGVPKYGLAVVLLTNRQNVGPDAQGYYTNLDPLRQAVMSDLVRAAAH